MSEWKKYEEAVEKGPMSLLLKVVVPIMVLIIGASVLMFIGNPLKQGARIVNKTIDADNVIYNYEWFKKQFRAVGAIDSKIKSQAEAVVIFKEDAGDRSDWTYSDKDELSRLRSIEIGLKQQRQDMIANYNAKANMANRKIFMGNDCPDYINPN